MSEFLYNGKYPQDQLEAAFKHVENNEYGRALYAVARSVLRALIVSISDEDLRDINTPLDRVTLRQLAKLARLPRDKGIRDMHGEHHIWIASLSDPDGFMRLFDDAYRAVAGAIFKLGKHEPDYCFDVLSAKAQRVQQKLEELGDARVLDVERALSLVAR